MSNSILIKCQKIKAVAVSVSVFWGKFVNAKFCYVEVQHQKYLQLKVNKVKSQIVNIFSVLYKIKPILV